MGMLYETLNNNKQIPSTLLYMVKDEILRKHKKL